MAKDEYYQFSKYKNDIEFYQKENIMLYSSTQKKPLPDSLVNAKGSMKFLISNTILDIFQRLNKSMKILNDFKNQADQVYLRKNIVDTLTSILER